ncbi:MULTISPECIES: branched-chain amino acid ABC transporter substrate-binding protein [unclassified Undibacterium]|uniref:branched-chain amino acid ABC transporter substrate-binding protein n=1 Tax=unclassified Undibacterium TaxID=2630295 RepID=UPI002AC98DF7|nr:MULTISPECIES: branched-chain amino acid ABC transporter substrate-binding protein [unclassified Undibacterium]MEB0139133.1 branched-chain amino acid ABC transporter substrate-binding protein [Undibacterium sp. CCC2.1]MEB0172887.1 branched-chain amino acid ABC transporter substrate-binding protein [Undibacterium sp. CCC1.1]MEB0176641.1 branched-chain amino acid ABC transporter substrate-binding protein [Undibacterium sp. CCC3.4]MEB0216031.1 branched-chain amino acid ABC transporter substrate-
MAFKLSMVSLAIASTVISFAAAAQEVQVKIGHAGPISGGIAHIGKDNENGVRMAVEQLNAKGVMIGGKKARFSLLAEDDAGDPKQATSVAQKLVDAKVSGVIGHVTSGASIPASRIYNHAGIPEISAGTSHPKYTLQGFPVTFRVTANDGQLGAAVGRYAVEVSKAKKIAVIDDKTAYGQGLANEFIKSAKAAGGDVVVREHTTDKATDFAAVLTSVKAKKPDMIFFAGLESTAGPMLRQMKALGMNTKFMGGDAICTPNLPKFAGDSMADEQVVCASAGGVPAEQKPAYDQWRADYKKRFGIETQLYAGQAYDATMTMVQAMQDAGSSEPAKYLPFLKKIHYRGISGDISFDNNGDLNHAPITLYTYRGGKIEALSVTK